MRVSRTARTVDAESTTTSAGSAPSSPSADTASESESVAAAVGLQKTALSDAHWEASPDELSDRPEPSSDPLAYTVREEALV